MDRITTSQQGWKNLVKKALSNYKALSIDERVWFNAESLVGAIRNGGLISYYYNSGADHLDDCIEALRTLHAHHALRLVLEVNAIFPGGVPKTVTGRNEVINSWSDCGPEERVIREHNRLEQMAANEIQMKIIAFCASRRLGI